MHQTLTIPQHRDPVARVALAACALALVWLAITSALPAASAQEQPRFVVVVATPTLPVLIPTEAPVVAPAVSAPTVVPTFVPTEAPPAPAPAVVVAPAPVQEAPVIGERTSDKAGPGERSKAPPVVKGH